MSRKKSSETLEDLIQQPRPKKTTCNRCGKELGDLNQLCLLQTVRLPLGPETRNHTFDLCDDCARAVFRFMGEKADQREDEEAKA